MTFCLAMKCPLQCDFFLAFVIVLFSVGAGWGLCLLKLKLTASRMASSETKGKEIERAISEVVHKTYDHRDTAATSSPDQIIVPDPKHLYSPSYSPDDV